MSTGQHCLNWPSHISYILDYIIQIGRYIYYQILDLAQEYGFGFF
jgi:hypothetical protein